MENRRPPKSNPSGPGRYYDRSRGNAAGRPGGPGRSENTGSADRPYRDSRTGRGPGDSSGRGPVGGRGPRFGGGPVQERGRFGAKPPKNAMKAPPEVKITSDLQVTDGKFKGRLLGNSVSPRTKPMPRAVRDSMFRVIARRVRGGRFLDLCAGCGTIGIEAISRGAMLSTFVERSARAATHLRKNLTDAGIKDGHFEVVEMEAVPYINRSADRKRTWDIVFAGAGGTETDSEIVEAVSRGRVIEPGGIAVIEHPAGLELPEKLGVLSKWRTITKDDVSISFYNRK